MFTVCLQHMLLTRERTIPVSADSIWSDPIQ